MKHTVLYSRMCLDLWQSGVGRNRYAPAPVLACRLVDVLDQVPDLPHDTPIPVDPDNAAGAQRLLRGLAEHFAQLLCACLLPVLPRGHILRKQGLRGCNFSSFTYSGAHAHTHTHTHTHKQTYIQSVWTVCTYVHV